MKVQAGVPLSEVEAEIGRHSKEMFQNVAQQQSPPPWTDSPLEPVWVYESDVSGTLVGSVAGLAASHHGAEPGNPGRLVGNSYALPTRDEQGALLSMTDLGAHVRRFHECAAAEPGRQFRIMPGTRSKSESEHELFAGLFRTVPGNVILPGRMLEFLGRLKTARIVLRDINVRVPETDCREKALREYFACNAALWGADEIEIVSYGSPQVLVANEKFVRDSGYKHRILSVNDQYYGRQTAKVRELLSITYATRLLCVGDPMGTSTGTHVASLQLATLCGLALADVLVDNALTV
ncbi:MAG: hypothetical protein H6977_06625 [Gammaproteobacteria bacterium]|nr:hypothetical protein [Gammaproteobacteria bacterium]